MHRAHRRPPVRLAAILGLLLLFPTVVGCLSFLPQPSGYSQGYDWPTFEGYPHLVDGPNGSALSFSILNWVDPKGYEVMVVTYPLGTTLRYDLARCDASEGSPGVNLTRNGALCTVSLAVGRVLHGVPSAVFLGVLPADPADFRHGGGGGGGPPIATMAAPIPLPGAGLGIRTLAGSSSSGSVLRFVTAIHVANGTILNRSNLVVRGYIYEPPEIRTDLRPDAVWRAAPNELQASWNVTLTAAEAKGGLSPADVRFVAFDRPNATGPVHLGTT